MQNKMIKVSVLALSLAMLGGCADIAQVEEAKAAAAEAMAAANDAYQLAQSASINATEAGYAASKAQETADAALACCNDNSSKLDRMFEKAMAK